MANRFQRLHRFPGDAPHRPLILAILLILQSSAFAQLGDIRGVHDPRIIQSGEFFYLFSTGLGIPIRQSNDLVTWQSTGSVFSAPPAWIAKEFPGARFFWAPDISYFANTYHLYFAVSRFGKNNSRIGLETNTTLDPKDVKHPWIDHGPVIETHLTDNWNAIDPAVAFDTDNNPWLVMGSFWDGIKMRRLDPTTGLLSPDDPKLYSLARRPKPDAIEAPYIFHHGDYFYLFVSFDYCCRGVKSTYKIMVGRSRQITGPYTDETGKAMLDGGGSLIQATRKNVIGPGHCGVLHARGTDWLVHHFYDGNDHGRATLEIQPLTWDANQWP
ncbi:MAG: arabinan endo-1,5-alpha-L-arabinosidase, partial [Tepidisphaeraceae bacterium]